MYIPKHFSQPDQDKLINLICSFPFATLISNTSEGLEADHLPVFYEEQSQTHRLIKGHIAVANPLWKTLEEQSSVLLIFQGPNHYISPNWYPSKKVDPKVVPTWNYMTVHVRGKIHFVHDNQWKMHFLRQLTDSNEAKQKEPWTISDAPEEFIKKQFSAIVGFEVIIESMTGKWKMSQNQSLENRQGVKEGLAQSQLWKDDHQS